MISDWRIPILGIYAKMYIPHAIKSTFNENFHLVIYVVDDRDIH